MTFGVSMTKCRGPKQAARPPMNEIFDRILTFNLVGSTVVFFVAARIYLWPRFDTLSASHIVIPILLLHSFRHLGLMFLTTGAIYPGMPSQFAYPAAIGDLIAAILAFASLFMLLRRSAAAGAFLWAFNIFGSLDLVAAIVLATVYNAPIHMGPAYWIPAFWVPALLVTHYILFILLVRRRI